MSPEFEQIRSKRAFLVPLSVAVAAAISACGGTKTETVTEPGHTNTIYEKAPEPKKHSGPTAAEEREAEKEELAEIEREIEADETEEELEAAPPAQAPESSHYSHGSHNSHSSHSSHVSSYGGEYGGGHYSHSSHASHSSHYSSS